MKIRLKFVSNSSSSSFVLVWNDENDMGEVLKKIYDLLRENNIKCRVSDYSNC